MAERGPEILRCRTAVNMGVLVGRQQRCLGQGWEVPGSRKTECADFLGAGRGGGRGEEGRSFQKWKREKTWCLGLEGEEENQRKQ